MRTPVIRDLCPTDRSAFAGLWSACLSMHGVPAPEEAIDRSWSLFLDEDSPLKARVACLEDRVMGLAVHSWQPNSWTGGIDGCLDTLFVASEARGTGLGRALLDDLLRIGRSRGWSSVFWHVRSDNLAARALYGRYASDDGYLRYRVALIAAPD
jgi:ribosomal protein S18 acetylase RimI-like enzyme